MVTADYPLFEHSPYALALAVPGLVLWSCASPSDTLSFGEGAGHSQRDGALRKAADSLRPAAVNVDQKQPQGSRAGKSDNATASVVA